jgi:hypothetical protein
MEKNLSVANVTAVLGGVRLPFGLLLDEFTIEGENLHVGIEPYALSMDSPGRFKAVITEAAIKQFLDPRLPTAIRKSDVEVVEGKILINALAKIIIEVRVSAVCTLESKDGRMINVVLTSVEPGGPVRGMLESQLDQINPVFDANDLPIPVTVESVSIEPGRILLTGTIRPA